MKGLPAAPGLAELEAAYARLQDPKSRPAVPEFSLWSQWSRFDPRLAEQLVERLALDWKELPPLALREALRSRPWPQAWGVLCEHALLPGKVPRADRRLFRAWVRLVLADIPAAGFEQFFIGVYSFGGRAMAEQARLSIRPYLRWGYFGRDKLVNKAAREGGTVLPAARRREALEVLLESRSRLTVNDYREALGGQVGRRQAELDLRASSRLISRGRTRGRYYSVRGASRGGKA